VRILDRPRWTTLENWAICNRTPTDDDLVSQPKMGAMCRNQEFVTLQTVQQFTRCQGSAELSHDSDHVMLGDITSRTSGSRSRLAISTSSSNPSHMMLSDKRARPV
jgi:hypothetical protein